MRLKDRLIGAAKWIIGSVTSYIFIHFVWPFLTTAILTAGTFAVIEVRGVSWPAIVRAVVSLGVGIVAGGAIGTVAAQVKLRRAYRHQRSKALQVVSRGTASLTMYQAGLVPTVTFDLGVHAAAPYRVDILDLRVGKITFQLPVEKTIRQEQLPMTLKWRKGFFGPACRIVVHEFTREGVVLQDDVPGVMEARFAYYRA